MRVCVRERGEATVIKIHTHTLSSKGLNVRGCTEMRWMMMMMMMVIMMTVHQLSMLQHTCVCVRVCGLQRWRPVNNRKKRRLTGAESQWGPRERTFSQ